MNRDDINKLARQAYRTATWLPDELERFAALVAAAERDACAQVAEGFDACDPKHIAAAIRARGQSSLSPATIIDPRGSLGEPIV